MSNLAKRPYLSTGEIARICHISRATVFNWIKDGKLKASRIPGGKYKIFNNEFLSFMKKAGLLPLVEDPEVLSHGIKILIVDDQPKIVESIKIFLEKTDPNFHVTGATSGFEAGQLVFSFKPDVIILDLIMPDVDGFAVCKNIKSNSLTKNTKIIAVTGYPTEENRKKIKLAGADAIFVKPLDYRELLKKIAELFKLNK
ncbi:MAG TPA: response regulator [bacterium]|nr:response regulator [bacterium]